CIAVLIERSEENAIHGRANRVPAFWDRRRISPTPPEDDRCLDSARGQGRASDLEYYPAACVCGVRPLPAPARAESPDPYCAQAALQRRAHVQNLVSSHSP